MVTKEDKVDILLQERPYVAQIIQTQLLNDIAGILYEQLATMKDAVPDLMKKYSDGFCGRQTKLVQDQLRIPLEAVIYSGPYV